jgi:hypothetical protein
MLLYDTHNQPLLLFESEFSLRWALQNEQAVTFSELPP